MTTSQQAKVQVARSLPISNTGSIALRVSPEKGQDIIVEVSQTALLVPGEYNVYPAIHFPKPPGVSSGPGPVILPLAHISYDHALQHFNVQVDPRTTDFSSGQFSVLVNLSDLSK